MNEWNVKVSTLLTVLSIVGIIVGFSIAFGEIRGGVVEAKARIRTTEDRMINLEMETRKINKTLTQVSTDLQWIRALIEGYAQKVHDLEE